MLWYLINCIYRVQYSTVYKTHVCWLIALLSNGLFKRSIDTIPFCLPRKFNRLIRFKPQHSTIFGLFGSLNAIKALKHKKHHTVCLQLCKAGVSIFFTYLTQVTYYRCTWYIASSRIITAATNCSKRPKKCVSTRSVLKATHGIFFISGEATIWAICRTNSTKP